MRAPHLKQAAMWVLFASLATAGDLKLFEAVEPHMGTLVRIQLYAATEEQASTAFRAAFARIADIDATLSDYKPDSELNRIARTAVRKPVAVSADLFEVLGVSQKLAEETGGAFDITLGPVIRLWRQARKEKRLPDDTVLREAAAKCGYRKLHVDPKNRTAMLDQAGMQLDVGGIAKGYAADAAIMVLAKLGIRSALVAASGDLAIGDPPPGRRGWKIGVDNRVLELFNAGVSTSGDAEQHLDAGSKRHSHIVNPATTKGLTGSTTVTVVARTGMEADSLATALSVLTPERAAALIELRPGVSVFRAPAR